MLDPVSHLATAVAARFGFKKLKEALEEHRLLPSHVYHSRTIDAVKQGDFKEAVENLRITLEKDPMHSGGRAYQNLLASNVNKKLEGLLDTQDHLLLQANDCRIESDRITRSERFLFWLGYGLISLGVISLMGLGFFVDWIILIGCLSVETAIILILVKKLNSRLLVCDKKQDDLFEKEQNLKLEMTKIDEQLRVLKDQYDEVLTLGNATL